MSEIELPSAPLEGRYVLGRPLGRGAYGQVVEAHDRVLARKVAVKLYDHPDAGAALREARAMAIVDHPNVVRVHGAGLTPRGAPYVVMDHVDGPDLRALAARAPRGRGERIGILRGILDGLEAIHDAGLTHGDVKPANVLLDHDGRPRLTDFGLVQRASDWTSQKRVAGSPAYMAPERATVRVEPALASRVDLYAFGVLTFQLLTGALPFDAAERDAMVREHLFRPAPRPTLLAPDLGPALDALVLGCLAKDPRQRLPTAAQARTLLDRIAPHPARLLLVDDDEDFRAVTRRFLERAFPGLDVVEAGSVQAARSALAETSFDAILSDFSLPDGTAEGLARIGAKQAPFFVMSGIAGPPQWSTLAPLGARNLLPKPVSPSALVDQLRSALVRPAAA
ncbi:MAG: hypothetical protein CMN29_17645 [Sandaracinus sp.]|nr:hypothetical protein [Sandaracinus sp.]